MEQYLVIDLEFCRVNRQAARFGRYYGSNEIIEIGAVILNEDNTIADRFKSFVKPLYGMPDAAVSSLTGITEEDLKDAPSLEKALRDMAVWMGSRKLIAASWSDADYVQLSVEMEQKRIRNESVEALFENWVDLQKAYTELKGQDHQVSLKSAMEESLIAAEGKLHDGADDAFNTAKLIGMIRAEKGESINIKPIAEHLVYEEDMGVTMGSIFGNLKFD